LLNTFTGTKARVSGRTIGPSDYRYRTFRSGFSYKSIFEAEREMVDSDGCSRSGSAVFFSFAQSINRSICQSVNQSKRVYTVRADQRRRDWAPAGFSRSISDFGF